MQIDRILQKIGLSPKEIRLYLAALEIGIASAQQLGKQANLPRTTAYSVLESLVKHGVVAKTVIKRKTRFVAEPPEKLLSIIEELRNQIKTTLPQLEAIYNKSETKPKITFFEGKNAVQQVYDDTLETKPDEILEWNTDAYFQFNKYKVDPHYIEKRVKLGIKAKRMAGKGSGWDTKHKRLDTTELSETIIVSKDVFWPEIEVNIYGSKLAFLNYAENMSVIIESKAIVDAMRQAYHLSWIGAKALGETEGKF